MGLRRTIVAVLACVGVLTAGIAFGMPGAIVEAGPQGAATGTGFASTKRVAEDLTPDVVISPSTVPVGGLATVTVTFDSTSATPASVTSVTATIPDGFAFIRNSTTVNGAYIDDGFDNEPPGYIGSLVWPHRPGEAPWPLAIPAEAYMTFAFQVASRGNPAGAAALNVSATTSSGHTVSTGSSEITAVASIPGSLVLPVAEDTWVDQSNPGITHGSDTSFDVQGGGGTATENQRWKGLLKFDLGAIPDGSTVTGATLRLGTTEGFSVNGDPNHYAVVVPDTWTDGEVSWDTRPADGFTGTVPCTFTGATPADLCDAPASVLTEANTDFLGGGEVFYGLPLYAIVPHIHTIPRPSQTGALTTRLAQRVQTEKAGDDTLSIEIVNPCCGPSFSGYWARYATEESGTQDLKPALVLTLSGGEGPSTVVTTTADSGPGSLRQAIIDANAQAGVQTITFNITVPEIGPKFITLLTPLPGITDPVTIAGTSQPGYPTGRVQLVGTGLGPESTGLVLGTGSSPTTIIGLGIRDFDIGIQIQGGSGINTIGGDQTTGNVIWEFSDAGISLNGAGTGNVVSGNTIGLTPAGVPSPSSGEAIDVASTTGTVIGDSAVPGAVSADGNRGNILGGAAIGIRLGPGTTSTGMAANYIGVTRIGATPTSLGAGVLVNGGSGNNIGPFNLIASTAGVGVEVSSGSGNRIVANEIRNNGGKGIVLGPGANGGMPAPVLDATATRLGTTTTINGDIFGAPPNTPIFVEFFTNAACDTPSNAGEGRTYIFFTGPTTNVDGFASFTFTSDTPVVGEVVTATATNAFTSSTSEFSNCASVTAGGGGGGIVLDAVQASVPSTGRVPLASIPGSALVARPAGSTQASPIRDIPIRDIPIRDIPIRDIPIRDIPIADIGFTNGNVLPLLSSFALSDIPLLRAGGWPGALTGTDLGTAPPQNVTLRDVLALSPVPPAFATQPLTLEDLDLSRTALGRVPAVAVVLGAVPLGQLELPAGADWCQLAGPGVTCSPSSNVLAISIQGAPIADIPIADIPIRDIPIADIPIADIPIRDIPIADIPIRDIPIADIPIADIDSPQSFVNCGVINCVTGRLYDAFTFGTAPPNSAFVAGATLGDLLLALPEPNDVTLADVLVLLFSSTAAIGWEQIDLGTAGLQAAAGGTNGIDWRADVPVTGPGTIATITLPNGSIFDPSVTPQVSFSGGVPIDLPAPEIASTQAGPVTLKWLLVGGIGTVARITFQTFPPFRVGPQSGTAARTAGGPAATSAPAPISVTDTFEPNGADSAEPVSPDSLYVSYITQADDLDYYALPTPPVGSTIRVYLSHLQADYDLAVYAPADAQLRPEVAGTEPLDSPPLGDEGVPLTTRQDALPPETLDDLRIDTGRPLVGVSANRGQEDDVVVAVSGGGTGNYLIQVTPYNGATSTDAYVLRVEVEPPRLNLSAAALPGATGTAGTVPALPAGTNTLFLWNRSQIEAQYPGSTGGLLTAMQQTQTTLTTLGFPSAIVGVDGNAAVAGAYAAWNADPGDPNKANAVVRSINALVDSLRGQPNGAGIKYLVLVGGDRAIPFGRLEDYVSISNESGYAQSVGANNELSAALGAGRILSDDPYGDTTPVQYLNRQLFVPDLSVGRLVESPTEIVAALTRYRTFNGRLNPTTGTVFGYDFLSDGATEVRTALNARPGLNVPANATFINQTWTQANVIGALLTTAPSVASLNGHADHSRLQPPSVPNALTRPVPFTTANLTADATATLPNRLVFSMGCHAGLSVGDATRGAAGARLAAGIQPRGRDVPRQHDVRLRRHERRRVQRGAQPSAGRAGSGRRPDRRRTAAREERVLLDPRRLRRLRREGDGGLHPLRDADVVDRRPDAACLRRDRRHPAARGRLRRLDARDPHDHRRHGSGHGPPDREVRRLPGLHAGAPQREQLLPARRLRGAGEPPAADPAEAGDRAERHAGPRRARHGPHVVRRRRRQPRVRPSDRRPERQRARALVQRRRVPVEAPDGAHLPGRGRESAAARRRDGAVLRQSPPPWTQAGPASSAATRGSRVTSTARRAPTAFRRPSRGSTRSRLRATPRSTWRSRAATPSACSSATAPEPPASGSSSTSPRARAAAGAVAAPWPRAPSSTSPRSPTRPATSASRRTRASTSTAPRCRPTRARTARSSSTRPPRTATTVGSPAVSWSASTGPLVFPCRSRSTAARSCRLAPTTR